jgi:hypothetical protein
MSIEQAATQEHRGEPRRNLICDYYPQIQSVMSRLEQESVPERHNALFAPPFSLPVFDAKARQLFSVATASWESLGSYRGRRLVLLDLMQNPGTRTTKTIASLLMVARAIEHIRRTGEKIALIAPTSGNKGVALRDAVERAVSIGLVNADQLRVIIVAPQAARRKLRSGTLASDEQLRSRNPILLYEGSVSSRVKDLAQTFVASCGADLKRRYGLSAWFTLDLRNYQAGDAARAFIEQDVDPLGSMDSMRRIHAHAVSSAYGLLGYALGLEILKEQGWVERNVDPGMFLVQHLATPDMVLSLYHDSFSRQNVPRYVRNDRSGLYEQNVDINFPYRTFAVEEEIDATFYTKEPVTVGRMNALIRRNGGGGIVVSLAECLERYNYVCMMLERVGISVPADPRNVLEWSLIMAVVGVLNGIDREIIPADSEVIVHGTGLYTTANTPVVPDAAIVPVQSIQDIRRAVEAGLQ